jgi:hypothetical protein
MIGGTAYAAGRAGARAQERAYDEQAAQADQEARLAALEAQRGAQAPAPQVITGNDGSDIVAELTKLKGLLDAGALNQQEFEAAKQRVLAGG